MTKIDKLRLLCLISAFILLLTQTLYESVVLLERQLGPIIPSYLAPLIEIFNQWERFWFDSDYPVQLIPLPAITYPAIFCFIYACCGNITQPPPPLIISGPLCLFLPVLGFFSNLIGGGG